MPTNARSQWRLRTDRFDTLARTLFGVTTDRAIAARLRVNTATLSDIRNGKRPPSHMFMAACKREMPSVPVEEIFELDEAAA